MNSLVDCVSRASAESTPILEIQEMERNECIHTRVSAAEKRRLVDAARQAGQTTADYIRTSALERMGMDRLTDRLITSVAEVISDHMDPLRGDAAALTGRLAVTATKADLTTLAEWLSARIASNKENI